MPKRLIIAIDGPAGAGKSTIARHVASRVGAIYIDTGAMYRAIALWSIRAGIPRDDSHRLEALAQNATMDFVQGSNRLHLNGEDVSDAIRTPEIASAASEVAALPGVRRAMVRIQREIASHASVVMEGRDIGSIVFPNADVKIFLDATPHVRATRRAGDFEASNIAVDFSELARELELRDARDRNRAASPLIQSPDATYLDSTELSPDQVVEEILKIVRLKTSNGKELVH